ncbi:DNA-directed RNA polymerase III RPC5 [Cryptosporidium felis]|nr:DNA-directed RNA polymerase III RPC5 [Cryptosporidium felis]
MNEFPDDLEDEYEVILSHINDVSFHIFQFPMTSADDHVEKIWQSAFVRPDGGSFQLSYYPVESPERSSSSMDDTGDSGSRSTPQGKLDGINKNHLYTVNSKSCLSSANCLVAGHFDHKNKKLFITPISSVQQFRPNFSEIDQRKPINTDVGTVERSSLDSTDRDERNQSLDDLILNHGNTSTDVNYSGTNLDSEGLSLEKTRLYTTGSENWIRIPCIYPQNSYESNEIVKTLMDINFDEFISWNYSDSQISGNKNLVNQLISRKHYRKKTHFFDGDLNRYFKVISGIARDGVSGTFNLPFGGDGQVLPTLRTAGLPKIYTAYQYPPSCPNSSLGGSMSYNFGGIDDSNSISLIKSYPEKYINLLPFHGISGKLLVFDDWLHYGPLSVQELFKMELLDQVQRITLVYQVIPFSGIKKILQRVYDFSLSQPNIGDYYDSIKSQGSPYKMEANSTTKYGEFPSDDELIKALRKFCVLVSGNWVYKSELLYNDYESCCRDLILVLLQRDENVGLNREPIRVATDLPQIKVTNILHEVSSYRSTAWYPKFPLDKKFIDENIEEATYWKSYWLEREKFVVQYIRDNRDSCTCTNTNINNNSLISTTVSNSQLQLLLAFVLRIYGASSIPELLNLCSYHLTLMSVGNAASASVPSTVGGISATDSSNKPGGSSSNAQDSSSITYGKVNSSSKSSQKVSSGNNALFLSSLSLNQNYIAPTYSPFCSSYQKHCMKQTSFINVNTNISSSIKISREDLAKSLEMIATEVFGELWVLKSTGDPRVDSVRRIVIDLFGKGIKEDIFTITSFIDKIKQSIVKSCAISSKKDRIWYKLDYGEDIIQTDSSNSNEDDISFKSSQLLHFLNNVPEFIWRKIIHEFAFPVNETATVWKLKGR